MPTYDYKCSSNTCGHSFEANIPIASRESAPCPVCHLVAPRIFAPLGLAFALRGTGWSQDGYHPPPTGADLRAGRVSPKDLKDIPVVGRDGRLRSKDGKVIAG
jgi:putative FmdB family regulatory protein